MAAMSFEVGDLVRPTARSRAWGGNPVRVGTLAEVTEVGGDLYKIKFLDRSPGPESASWDGHWTIESDLLELAPIEVGDTVRLCAVDPVTSRQEGKLAVVTRVTETKVYFEIVGERGEDWYLIDARSPRFKLIEKSGTAVSPVTNNTTTPPKEETSNMSSTSVLATSKLTADERLARDLYLVDSYGVLSTEGRQTVIQYFWENNSKEILASIRKAMKTEANEKAQLEADRQADAPKA